MSTGRARRLPVSCEPCRLRKIRCPRDGPPCSTCRRRGVPTVQCQYAVRTRSPRSASTTQQAALGPLSPCTETHTLDAGSVDNENTDLAARVQKLENLLRGAPSLAGAAVGASTASETVDRHGQPSNTLAPTARPTSPGQLQGTLRTNEAGYMRFIPQALAWDPGSKGLGDGYQSPIVASQPDSPFGSRRTSSKPELMLSLPPQGACQELLNVYFQSFASLFHILHDPTFYRQYACFLEDPQSMPLSWLALLYAILATAILALPCDSTILSDLSRQRSPLARSLELTQRYRDMTMRVLEADNYLWNHNITTLQTLIILIYGISHSHGQTWTLLGLSHHLALSIGCHVDPDTLGLNAVQCEERRRAWAGLMMLYTNQNSALGHVGLPHTTFKASSRPPADVNDEDIGNAALSQLHTAGEATQMTYLLLKFRLYDICADICANVLCKSAPNLDLIRHIDDVLRDERRSWEARLSQTIEILPLRVHHKAHLNVLHSYADHLIILLHQRQALDSGCSASTKNWARSRCIESARHLLQIHAAMNEMPEMTPFRWYGRGVGSFHAFHAAALLVHLSYTNPIREEGDVHINLLQKCSSLFDSLAEYSTVCAKTAPVLRVLLHSLLGGSDASNNQDGSGMLQQVTPDYSNNTQVAPGEDMTNNWDDFLWQIPTQNWLASANLPWDDWSDKVQDAMISGPF